MNINKALRQIVIDQLPYFIILIFSLIVVNNWFRGGIIYGGDMSFIIYPKVDSASYFSIIINAFNFHYNAIGSYGANPQLFWYYGLIYLFSLIPSVFSEEIMILLLLSLGAIYVYRLVYEISIKSDKISKNNAIIAGIISASFYVSNWGLAEAYAYNIILLIAFIYPLLPLWTYYARALFVKSYGIHIIKNLILVSILGTVILSTAEIIYFLQIVSFMFLIFLFYSISKDLKKFIKNISLLILSFFLLLIGNYYWIKPAIKGASVTVQNLYNISLYYFELNSHYMPFTLVMRNLGFNGFFNFPEYTLILSFIIPILIIIPLLIGKKTKENIIYITITLIVITFWAGTNTPFGPIYLYLFEHFHYFIEFRTLNVAFAWLASFLFAITVGLGYASLSTKIKGKKRALVIGSILIIIISVIIPYPVFSGTLMERTNIPNYFINSVNYVNSLNNCGEVLILPTSPNWFFSTWYVGSNIWQFFSNKPVIYGGSYSSSELSVMEFYNNITNTLTLNNYTSVNLLELQNVFLLLNIKYIVVENDSTTTPSMVINKYVNNLFLLQKYNIVEFLHKFGNIYIFTTNVNSSYFYTFSPIYFKYVSNITVNDVMNINYTEILIPITNYSNYNNGIFILHANTNSGYLFNIFDYMPLWSVNNTLSVESYVYNSTFGNIFPLNISGTVYLRNGLQQSANISLYELFAYIISTFMILVITEIIIIKNRFNLTMLMPL